MVALSDRLRWASDQLLLASGQVTRFRLRIKGCSMAILDRGGIVLCDIVVGVVFCSVVVAAVQGNLTSASWDLVVQYIK